MSDAQAMKEKAVRTFLKIQDVEGASTYHQEVGSVEVLGWNHGFVQPSQIARSTGTSGSAGKANHKVLKITKQIDKTTRDLLKKCWEGGQIGEMTLSVYNADVCFLRIVMEKVILTDYAISESAESNVPVETLHCDYAKVKYTYVPVDGLGAAQGEIPVEHCLETGVIA